MVRELQRRGPRGYNTGPWDVQYTLLAFADAAGWREGVEGVKRATNSRFLTSEMATTGISHLQD